MKHSFRTNQRNCNLVLDYLKIFLFSAQSIALIPLSLNAYVALSDREFEEEFATALIGFILHFAHAGIWSVLTFMAFTWYYDTDEVVGKDAISWSVATQRANRRYRNTIGIFPFGKYVYFSHVHLFALVALAYPRLPFLVFLYAGVPLIVFAIVILVHFFCIVSIKD